MSLVIAPGSGSFSPWADPLLLARLAAPFTFSVLLAVRLWRHGGVPGHPHHRVLPGLHFKHRLLLEALGSQLSPRT